MDKVFVSPPLAPMPPEIARALFRSSPAPADDEAIPAAIAIGNPWTAKPNIDGVVKFTDENAEEQELRNALEPLEKLFHPDVVATSPIEASQRFRFSKQPPTPQESWDSLLEKRHTESDETLRAFIKRSIGDDVFPTAEDLALWIEMKDPEQAEQIRSIGKTL